MAQPPKEMKITGEQIQISNEPQVDPEGQTVKRQFTGTAPTSMRGAQTPSAAVQGSLRDTPLVVEYTGKAGEMANAARTACAGCKHWDRRAWLQFLERAEGPASSAESRQTIATMRARIATAIGNDPKAVEQVLHAQGICRVLSDWIESATGRDPMFWPALSWPDATCPNTVRAGPHELNVVTPAEPFGFFSPVDIDSERHGVNRYDAILKAVQNQNRR